MRFLILLPLWTCQNFDLCPILSSSNPVLLPLRHPNHGTLETSCKGYSVVTEEGFEAKLHNNRRRGKLDGQHGQDGHQKFQMCLLQDDKTGATEVWGGVLWGIRYWKKAETG